MPKKSGLAYARGNLNKTVLEFEKMFELGSSHVRKLSGERD